MKLHIPDQMPAESGAFSQHPRDVKKWLANLPQANMGDLTRELYTGMRALNRQTMPSKYRLENMEQLRKQTRNVFDYLKKYFINRTLPLQEKSQKIVTLNQSLLQEIIFGYKILVQDTANGVDTKLDNKSLALAICRAIRYMDELLLRTGLIYGTAPSGTWLDMHSLYAYAREKKLDTQRLPDHEHPAGKATIESYYKQALLYALARPTSLRQSDSERIYHRLSDWEHLATLSSKQHEKQINRFFCVRLEENRPPSYLTQRDFEIEQKSVMLDTTALVNAVHKEIDKSTQKPDSITVGEQISVETLKALSMSWGICPKRRFSRADQEGNGNIEAAIGLTNAAQAMSGGGKKPETRTVRQGPIPPKKGGANLTLQTISSDMRTENKDSTYITHPGIDKPQRDAWDDVGDNRPQTETYSREQKTAAAKKQPLNKETTDLHWEVVNVSAGGYCLRWDSETTSRAQIGELIALRAQETDGSYHWLIGVIRWMQFTRGSGLEIGSQTLSPKVIAAKARRHNKLTEQPFDCLMLPGIRSLKQGPSVLTPAHAFKAGDRLTVTVLGQAMNIKLVEAMEHTGSFTQFQFANSETDARQQKTEKKQQSEKNPDDFDEIWSSL